MVAGVSKGFERSSAWWVWASGAARVNKLNLQIGFSHPVVNFEMPAGIKVETPTPDGNPDQGR
jgi:ribosomal protein L6P/L9E